jgi:CRISPR/Cas system-associated endonuclease Cas3-HD
LGRREYQKLCVHLLEEHKIQDLMIFRHLASIKVAIISGIAKVILIQ